MAVVTKSGGWNQLDEKPKSALGGIAVPSSRIKTKKLHAGFTLDDPDTTEIVLVTTVPLR